ncbi:GntR family transcriptional regulator [Sphingomonas crocodyli]|uniref:GntR family transcriptional regulator n=1 Tax=Sphingomonas crocodyli TaxID=1979270 RepID=A0A437M6M4_9SPHN|nr:GntR family transcriptional regulator [Sphingomonas crocodyli]RVT93206.1 GntR family transcriptional regulator [Sphingomonas crocodyli]
MDGQANKSRIDGALAAQRVVAGVKDALETGEFVPGQRLIEADLCLRFGVGRSHVREALHRLASENIVELFPNRGAAVRKLTPEQTNDAVELISLLIGHTARLAAERATDETARRSLRQAADGIDLAETGIDLLRARRAVHHALVAVARNDELGRILNSLQYHVLQVQVLLPRLHDEMNNDLKAIVAAVLAGEADQAEALARAHIRKMSPTHKS